MYKITVESGFSAAHSLSEYGGDCENIHGHNFKVHVTASFRELSREGMGIDFRELKKITREVLSKLDHRDLGNVEYFKEVNPTSENIAKYVYDEVKKKDIPVHRVTVFETDKYRVSYTEDG